MITHVNLVNWFYVEFIPRSRTPDYENRHPWMRLSNACDVLIHRANRKYPMYLLLSQSGLYSSIIPIDTNYPRWRESIL